MYDSGHLPGFCIVKQPVSGTGALPCALGIELICYGELDSTRCKQESIWAGQLVVIDMDIHAHAEGYMTDSGLLLGLLLAA